MDYDEIAVLCGKLSYRDKFRLAQLLIQIARKEEEEKNPDGRKLTVTGSHNIEYVAERLMKSKPAKKSALLNFIGARQLRILSNQEVGAILAPYGLKATSLIIFMVMLGNFSYNNN